MAWEERTTQCMNARQRREAHQAERDCDAARVGDNLEVLKRAALSRAVCLKTHEARVGRLSLDPKRRGHRYPGPGKAPQPVLYMSVWIRKNEIPFPVHERPPHTVGSDSDWHLATQSRNDNSDGCEKPQEPLADRTHRCAAVCAVLHVSPPFADLLS